MSSEIAPSYNFIEQLINAEMKSGTDRKTVHTRFPPEPNGYLHIGHAQSVWLNFTLAERFGGATNLRFDDTNPSAEKTEFVDGIQRDIRWLGFDWGDRLYFASDYFDQLYQFAVQLIKEGKAYVDDSTVEEMREMRGVPTESGIESPYRNRSIADNLELFEQMSRGDFADGARVLRAKVDMTSPNMHMRDPVMYRILHTPHHRTGDRWKIYPTYDFAHGQSDYIEGITHSVCTLEFEVHRPLYDWFLDQLAAEGRVRPKQVEFARLNVNYTVTSKRKLRQLVEEGIVNGWDDPRMPTVAGMRRRGYTPESIRKFAERAGVGRRENVVDMALLEFSVREHLNKITHRVMGVLDPIKVVITNYPEGQTEDLEIINNPEDPEEGSRLVPFSGELYIEGDDFMEEPPKKYFRLSPGNVVRLKGAYIIRCEEVVKDENGDIVRLNCTYIEDSRSGNDTSGVKAKGTIHWVSVPHALPAEVRLYDRLFFDESPDGHKEKDFLEFLNESSLVTVPQAFVEPSLKSAKQQERVQFMRKGYFCVDPDSSDDRLVFNRTVTLRDSWAKASGK